MEKIYKIEITEEELGLIKNALLTTSNTWLFRALNEKGEDSKTDMRIKKRYDKIYNKMIDIPF